LETGKHKKEYNAFLTSALRVGEINSTPPTLYPMGQSRRPGARWILHGSGSGSA